MKSFIDQFNAARYVSTPIILIRTPDPASTIMSVAMNAENTKVPILMQDCARGLSGVNPPGKNLCDLIIASMLEPPVPKDAGELKRLKEEAGRRLGEPMEMLLRAERLPKDTILFMSNLHLFFHMPSIVQAVWNHRDSFKQNMRTLVITCPDATLPPILAQDVLIIDEPLPDAEKLKAIVKQTYEAVDIPAPKPEILVLAAEALCGLAAFPAEQQSAMSIHSSGIDIEEVWERKRKAVEQVPGLSIARTKETFESVVGLDNAKDYHRRRGKGPKRRLGVVFIDEIDKHLAGFNAQGTGDTTTEMVGTLLTEMQDLEAEGSLFLGVAGGGKTLLGRAIANEWGVPCINYDLSGMKDSLVGKSGQNIRAANKVVRAVTQGSVYYIATCNRIENLPPELRRRFRSATFFFDLMTKKERESAWNFYEKKYSVKGERPEDDGWTASEINNCCYNAYVLKCSLLEAADYIVPLSISAQDQIEALQKQASGKFISASHKGRYEAPSRIENAEEGPTVVAVGVMEVPKRKIGRTGGGSGGTGSGQAN